nr:MAG TPA: hypothetical protein [Caudoviricetes sp.]
MPWVSSDAWGFLSFKERKKPRGSPGQKETPQLRGEKNCSFF